jgi:hypothetical protein
MAIWANCAVYRRYTRVSRAELTLLGVAGGMIRRYGVCKYGREQTTGAKAKERQELVEEKRSKERVRERRKKVWKDRE